MEKEQRANKVSIAKTFLTLPDIHYTFGPIQRLPGWLSHVT